VVGEGMRPTRTMRNHHQGYLDSVMSAKPQLAPHTWYILCSSSAVGIFLVTLSTHATVQLSARAVHYRRELSMTGRVGPLCGERSCCLGT